MYIKSVRLRNYRNYENQIIQFDKGMNIIIGDNGEGKTNLLEAIYLLSTTRSHRIDENRELIRFENEFGTVEGNIVSDNHASKMSVVVHKKGKTLMIDNNVIKRNSEFIGKINAVLFAPDDMNLFDDSPRTRRRLFDMEIGKLYPVYMYSLTNYLKYLKERNKFIKSVNEYISNYYNQISGENHQLRIEYKSVISEKNDEAVMKKQLQDLYSNMLDRDIYLKQTNSGIHREDYVFYLDDKDVSLYCSQGQKRTVILALKLAIVQIIFDIKKEYPVLLLDDVFSELDSNRRYNILKLLPASVQTIITTTDAREAEFIKDKNVYFINIKKGMMENAY